MIRPDIPSTSKPLPRGFFHAFSHLEKMPQKSLLGY